jgi:hypothetical protein
MTNQVQTWDYSPDLVVAAGTPEEAQNRFQAWIVDRQKSSTESEIKKIVAAQFLDQLLSESGDAFVDWTRVRQQADVQLEITPEDDSEQGYWVEVNDLVAPGRIAATVQELRDGLPVEVRNGLNWSPEKLFLFIVIVLSRPAATELNQHDVPIYDAVTEGGGECGGETSPDPDTPFPELAQRETAVLVEARNSVVAAWLWRRFAVSTPLAKNRIQLKPWCGAIGFESGAGQ